MERHRSTVKKLCYACGTDHSYKFYPNRDRDGNYLCGTCLVRVIKIPLNPELYKAYAKKANKKWGMKPTSRIIRRRATRLYYRRGRLYLYHILGGKCIQCGFSDIRALQLDHINGSGYTEIQSFKGAVSMYRFYINNPDIAKQKLQILCANCNWIKRWEKKEDSNQRII